ncbi:syncytin-1-like [Molossus molossus]|uniref:Syncytin 1 n=1 Tax=Molossus molossus TaxID=27622 RepID=A0A7J8GLT9_MOLMO|nr:syncytin-1-like [Molossus molossus]KAF6460559.1 hypothetical protein HJG59_011472 [Molossus molossus]
MKPVRLLILAALNAVLQLGDAGLQPPVSKSELYDTLYGKPCDCRGGIATNYAIPRIKFKTVDCGQRTAYLASDHSKLGGLRTPQWQCTNKPPIIPTIKGRPGTCPCTSFSNQMHSSCYESVQECTYNNKTYFTAILQRQWGGAVGGDWGPILPGGSHSKYAQASCSGTVAKAVCWSKEAPIHVSDGGGPQDKIKEAKTQKRLEQIMEQLYPKINYHPLALPKSRGVDLDTQTIDILDATHKALNISNPMLAADCWLCMTLGTPMPVALPVNITSYKHNNNCNYSLPFGVQPMGFSSPSCFKGRFQNNSYDIDVGFIAFANCSNYIEYNISMCPDRGTVFVCGDNLAYSALPQNWTGICVLATLLPDIDIISGDDPVPIPSFDYLAGRSKRAISFIPLLVGLGVSGALATGTVGIGMSLHTYTKLSNQLIDDVQALSSTIQDLQDQLDSLEEVVLQNRRGLDLLTAEQGGICLALQEKCCFYANKSGIVRDKIKQLQDDLVKRRKELFDNPLWSGLNGVLPYLLPLLGPLLGLLLLLSFGPMIFNKIKAFIKQQIEAIKVQQIQVHYHCLEQAEQGIPYFDTMA